MKKKFFLSPFELLLVVVGVTPIFLIHIFYYNNKGSGSLDHMYGVLESKVSNIDDLYKSILYNTNYIEESNNSLIAYDKNMNTMVYKLEKENKMLKEVEPNIIDIPYKDIRRRKINSQASLEQINGELDKIIYDLLLVNESLDERLKEQKSILSLVNYVDKVNAEMPAIYKPQKKHYYQQIGMMGRDTMVSLNPSRILSYIFGII